MTQLDRRVAKLEAQSGKTVRPVIVRFGDGTEQEVERQHAEVYAEAEATGADVLFISFRPYVGETLNSVRRDSDDAGDVEALTA